MIISIVKYLLLIQDVEEKTNVNKVFETVTALSDKYA